MTQTSVLPVAFVSTLFLMLFFGVFANPGLSLLALIVLWLGLALLWRPGEPMVLLFIFLMQWLQVTVKLWLANRADKPVQALAEFSAELAPAITFALMALAVLALAMRVVVGPSQPWRLFAVRAWIVALPPRIWWRLYIGAWILAAISERSAYTIPGLSQPLLAMASVKWAAFFMLSYVTFSVPHRAKWPFALAFMVEFAMGVGGFFSDYKTVFFITLLALAAAGVRLSVGRALGLVVLLVLVFVLNVFWTAIKVDYRSFVSGGEANQSVTVSYGARVAVLGNMLAEVDAERFNKAIDVGLARLSYVDFLASTMDYVPTHQPHTGGAMWWDALTRPFMPRLFFPGKAIIEDSARTSQYSGVTVAGADKGTSISIGYLGEAYIDGGMAGGLLLMALYGAFMGWLYRWLAYRSAVQGLAGMAIATAILLNVLLFETSVTKSMGALVLGALLCWFLMRFVLPRFAPWLLSLSTSRPPA